MDANKRESEQNLAVATPHYVTEALADAGFAQARTVDGALLRGGEESMRP